MVVSRCGVHHIYVGAHQTVVGEHLLYVKREVDLLGVVLCVQGVVFCVQEVALCVQVVLYVQDLVVSSDPFWLVGLLLKMLLTIIQRYTQLVMASAQENKVFFNLASR